jgi:outer membrane protein assembly factor BamD
MAMVLAMMLVGCASSQGDARNVSYSETARDNYEHGVAELKDENYLEAMTLFNFVKNRFPFSTYATLAELRIADVYFAQDKFADAADAYKVFARFHPNHPEVVDGYASYRACLAYVKQIPGDWFISPPAHEKDQSSTQDAMREIATFVKTYPESPYRDEVNKLYQKMIKKLVDHELYVAKFYLDRDKPRATIIRLEGILTTYPDADAIPQVMMLLAETYSKLKQYDRAQATYATLIEKFPNTSYEQKAKKRLDNLR